MDLVASARRALAEYLRVRPGESVLVIHDESVPTIAAAMVKAASELRISLDCQEIVQTGGHGQEPDETTAAMMQRYHVVVCPTRYSLTHTRATRQALAAGSRVATMPGIDEALFTTGLAVAPSELRIAGKRWIARLQEGRTIRIRSAVGTDLTFTYGQYPLFSDDGCLGASGVYGNLPAGEVFFAPNHGSANGIVAFDGTIGGQSWQPGSEPAMVTVKAGSAITFSGARGEALCKALATGGQCGLLLAEFGIGTHPGIILSGNLLGDEKLKGTVHLAFGNNCAMGGSNDVPVHLDALVLHPDLDLDGQPVVRGGQWLLD